MSEKLNALERLNKFPSKSDAVFVQLKTMV